MIYFFFFYLRKSKENCLSSDYKKILHPDVVLEDFYIYRF